MEYVDYHLHSNYSDGYLEPNVLLKIAAEKGISQISITDHDTIAAYKVLDNIPKVKTIIGMELSTQFLHCKEMIPLHLLAYGFKLDCEPINRLMSYIRKDRLLFAEELYSNIKRKYNISLPMDDAVSFCGALTFRFFFSQIERYFHVTINEAKSIYLDCKNDISPKWKPDLEEAISVIHRSHGVAVLAHPIKLECVGINVNDIIKQYSFDGIECYHPKHTFSDTQRYLKIAEQSSLIVTGGSDYHNPKRDNYAKYGGRILSTNLVTDLSKL